MVDIFVEEAHSCNSVPWKEINVRKVNPIPLHHRSFIFHCEATCVYIEVHKYYSLICLSLNPLSYNHRVMK